MDRNSVSPLYQGALLVVPRKGDVDRNRRRNALLSIGNPSSPARGTWIEMSNASLTCWLNSVVPRKGDVDRNRQRSG